MNFQSCFSTTICLEWFCLNCIFNHFFKLNFIIDNFLMLNLVIFLVSKIV